MAYQSKHTGKQIDDGIDAVGSKLGRTDDLTNNVVTFVEAGERTDIASGETTGTLFGKILRWLKSLGKTAFSDDYNDLTNKPTKLSEFTNDAGYLKTYTETDPTVPSHVKGITQANITSWNNKAEKSQIPTDVSQLNNDSKYVSETELANKGYITDYTETDPTIPAHVKNIKASDITTWNNKAEKTAIPTKTSQLANDSDYASQSFVRNEIANAQLGGDDTEIDLSGYATKDDLATKVDKVTGKSLIADSEITRLASVKNYDDSAVQESITNLQNNKADASKIPTKTSQLANDSGFITQHQDISGKLDTTGNSSNTTVAFTQASSRTNIATGEKLSTIFGKIKKWLADLKTVAFTGAYTDLSGTPTKLSDFTNDKNFISSVPSEYVTETELIAKGYITGYTETDPTVPSWAKASTKPSYSKSEVGLGNVDNVKQYSASNPPPYPVNSVNGQTGAVTISVPEKLSDLEDDIKVITLDTNSPIEVDGKWYGSQEAYEAITTLDANTEYNIIEE